MNFSDFLIWCFWACLEVICKKLWKRGILLHLTFCQFSPEVRLSSLKNSRSNSPGLACLLIMNESKPMIDKVEFDFGCVIKVEFEFDRFRMCYCVTLLEISSAIQEFNSILYYLTCNIITLHLTLHPKKLDQRGVNEEMIIMSFGLM